MKDPAEPKRRNATQTRARILETAQQAFAEDGYSQAGIRDIARSADVAPSLLLRYFGSKAGLFEAALLKTMYAGGVFERDKSRFGARMARLMITDADTTLPAMIVLSTGDPDAREVTARITKKYIIEGLANWLGPPNARARAMNIIMICTGAAIYARQLPIGPVHRETEKWLARSLQEIVDQSADRAKP